MFKKHWFKHTNDLYVLCFISLHFEVKSQAAVHSQDDSAKRFIHFADLCSPQRVCCCGLRCWNRSWRKRLFMLPILQHCLQELLACVGLIVVTSPHRQLRKIWVCVEVKWGFFSPLFSLIKQRATLCVLLQEGELTFPAGGTLTRTALRAWGLLPKLCVVFRPQKQTLTSPFSLKFSVKAAQRLKSSVLQERRDHSEKQWDTLWL